MSKIYPGQSLHFACTFTRDGLEKDPSTVSLLIMDPDGQTDTYTYALAEIVNDAVGVYSKNVTLGAEGTWHFRWVGTGEVAAASEGTVEVERSVFV